MGFHIPRIIIPDFAGGKYGELYQKFISIDPGLFSQEALGIPIEEGSREISLKHLQDMCVLPHRAELKRRAQAGYYKWIISGMDWGGSDYQQAFKTKASYTVHAILGLNGDGTIDILHIKRYSGQGYRTISEDIVANHQAFGGYAIGSDAGSGQYYNEYLRENTNPDRHLILGYVGPNTAPISISTKGAMFNQYLLNKTEAVTWMLEAIKGDPDRGKAPTLRCFPWIEAKDYLSDFMNAYRVPAETEHGTKFFRWIQNPTRAVDVMHAINFGLVVGRLVRGEDLNISPAILNAIQSALGVGAAVVQRTGLSSPGQTGSYLISG